MKYVPFRSQSFIKPFSTETRSYSHSQRERRAIKRDVTSTTSKERLQIEPLQLKNAKLVAQQTGQVLRTRLRERRGSVEVSGAEELSRRGDVSELLWSQHLRAASSAHSSITRAQDAFFRHLQSAEHREQPAKMKRSASSAPSLHCWSLPPDVRRASKNEAIRERSKDGQVAQKVFR